MKKTSFKLCALTLCAVFASSLMITSCGEDKKKEEPAAPSVQEKTEPTEVYIEAETVIPRQMTFVVALNETVTFYEENEAGEMHPTSITVPNGTMLAAYADSTKEALRVLSSGKETREFIQVLFEGEEYWVQTSIIAVNARPALIVEDGLVYAKPKVDGTYSPTIKLGFGQIVAVHMTSMDEQLEDSGIKFMKVSFKYKDSYYTEKYMKATCLNDDESSVFVMKMVKNVDKASSKVAKQELVDSALAICEAKALPSSIKDIVMAKKSEVENRESDYTYSERYYFEEVHVDAVPGEKETFNLRDNPGVKSKVIKKISSGQAYDLIMMTEKTDKVGEATGHWYYVKVYSAKDSTLFDCAGWVFGDEFNYYSDNIDDQELAS